jgi:hypothetical protein
MENTPTTGESEKLQGIISMLGVGEVKCDKCGKPIRHMERYCINTHECPNDGSIFDTAEELNKHFSQKHIEQPVRGTRYCIEDSMKAGYLKTVRNKKTGEVFPAMFVLRDEEEA